MVLLKSVLRGNIAADDKVLMEEETYSLIET